MRNMLALLALSPSSHGYAIERWSPPTGGRLHSTWAKVGVDACGRLGGVMLRPMVGGIPQASCEGCSGTSDRMSSSSYHHARHAHVQSETRWPFVVPVNPLWVRTSTGAPG